tara:strand:- start:1932 stop:2546 length:615 start_codon:yes stop_codon:yes gene_type:complete
MKRVLVDYIGSIQVSPSQINESMNKNNGKLIVSGIMQRASTGGDENFNQNGRSYPLPILKKECETYKNTFVKERRALGELDHPDSQVVNLSNVSHNVLDLWWQGNDLMGKIEILSTPSGNIAKELMKSGIRLGISSRGMGSVKELGEGKVEVQDDFEIVCWDLVSNPSTQGAFMNSSLNENTNSNKSNKNTRIHSLISEIISVM